MIFIMNYAMIEKDYIIINSIKQIKIIFLFLLSHKINLLLIVFTNRFDKLIYLTSISYYKLQINFQKRIYNQAIQSSILETMAKKQQKTLNEKQLEQLAKKKNQKKQRKKQQKQQLQKRKQQVQKLKQQRLRQQNLQKEAGQTAHVDILVENENILTGKYYDHFKKVFQKNQQKALRYYQTDEPQQGNKQTSESEAEGQQKDQEKGKQGNQNGEQKYSRKQKKKMRWLKVAQLKAQVNRPDLVEAWDITASDPLFLLELKSLKNTIAVPRHWNQKSKFLQTKRGILKPMFKLPQYIQATGISKLRDPFSQRDGQKMVRQKLRQRMNPKLGKIDIDYQVLHDAFFKYQLKSNLTVFGDIYYQGKQDQSKSKQYKPGIMSETLRIALGITDYQAPPWIINMQRYGAPPSYPTLRILGSTLPFSQLTSYSVINKTSLEETAKKLGQPGLYATFKSYDEGEEEEDVDRGYWGEVNVGDVEGEDGDQEWVEDNGDIV